MSDLFFNDFLNSSAVLLVELAQSGRGDFTSPHLPEDSTLGLSAPKAMACPDGDPSPPPR